LSDERLGYRWFSPADDELNPLMKTCISRRWQQVIIMLMEMTKEIWFNTFCNQLGIDVPSEDEIEVLLLLAGSAAHASERTAAPIACWLVGRSGILPSDALELALRIEESEPKSD